MQATTNFTAQINGTAYALKKGEEFKGDDRAAAHLKAVGLIAEVKKAKEGKVDNNG